MSIINLKWSGATDLEDEIIGYELSYTTNTDIVNTSWILVSFIPTTNSYGTFSFNSSQSIKHVFRIRTKDAAQNFSEYKYLEVPFNEIYYISNTSNPYYIRQEQNSCELTNTDFALFSPMDITVGSTIMYNDEVLESISFFDGTRASVSGPSIGNLPRLWKVITPSMESYSLKINNLGVIQSSTLCGNINNVNDGLLSNVSTISSICNFEVIYDNIIYWQFTLSIGTLLYSDVSLTSKLNSGYYRILYIKNNIQYDFVISVDNNGVILTKNKYSLFCGFINPNNNTPIIGNNPIINPDYEQDENISNI